MTRSVWLLPSNRPFSYSCTATGDDTETQPDTGALAVAVSGTTREAVLPASIVTLCFTDPKSLSSTTVCSPGVRSAIVIGEAPRARLSTGTLGPGGSGRI